MGKGGGGGGGRSGGGRSGGGGAARAAANNRANQMNPNHSSYASSRGLSTGGGSTRMASSSASRVSPSQAARDNRANQLNPTHPAFASSRAHLPPHSHSAATQMSSSPMALSSPASASSRAALDHRSRQLNPEHASYHASRGRTLSSTSTAVHPRPASASEAAAQAAIARDNRSRQLNHFDHTFWQSRGFERDDANPPQRFYHGTTRQAADAIQREGFRPSTHGMLGRGVYSSSDRSKAAAFAGSDGVVLEGAFYPGSVSEVDASRARRTGREESSWQRHHDSAHVPAGRGVQRPEHCTKDPRRFHVTGSKDI